MSNGNTGLLSILNVGEGDIEIRFNPHQPEEADRAIAMLRDMQRRGYAILVKLPDGSYTRALAIDATTACYIISDETPIEVEGAIEVSDDAANETESTALAVREKPRRGRPRGRRRAQPITHTEGISIGPSAGG